MDIKNQESGEYQASDAGAFVKELFSGEITVTEAIERLRTRLLDLSARNRLLNYRHPKGRCVQIANSPNLNLVFDRLYVDGKGVALKYVPEPPPDTYAGKRPEAKVHATGLRISTSFEFPRRPAVSDGHRLHGIQTLLYPADLERQMRKIASEAKTAIEETGTNMLFLVFGFLEFYDNEASERPMLAPLLALPVTLVRGGIDGETRTYQYAVQHNGEDLAENHTLREKLRRDFTLSLPEFGDEDEPEQYFARIERAIKNKGRWRVSRQITLGMLSFGKLALWADLDTKKNRRLLDHELIRSVFSGGSGEGGGALYAEDYHIDERPEASEGLIYDADSSQHSAIIDVLSGKNLVVNGPPGTGKSQTITNIIAAALTKGKKVLFVSEKLAALEVVRQRLNHAGLGHFCLELHSHKAHKKRFLEDIQARIDQRFPAPSNLQARLETLKRQKRELARYAELMGSHVGNALGLTVNEVFWAAERRRQDLGNLAAVVNAIGFPDASKWAHDDIESRRSLLAGLAELYDVIGRYDINQPWWGFCPNPLAPSDDEAIARTIREALAHAEIADAAADGAVAFFGLWGQPDAEAASEVAGALNAAPKFHGGADPALLPTMFDAETDPNGQRSSRLIDEVTSGVKKARLLLGSAARVLADGARAPAEEIDGLRKVVERERLTSALQQAEIGDALATVTRLEKAAEVLEASARLGGAPYGPASLGELHTFLGALRKPFVAALVPFAIRSVASRAATVLQTAKALGSAIGRVNAIAARRGIPFDTSPDAIAQLADPRGLPGLARDIKMDAASMDEARRLAVLPFSDRSLEEIGRLKSLLEKQASACSEALDRCRLAAERMGVGFDASEASVAQISALADVAASAPQELLEYRRPTFGHARTAELIAKTRSTLAEAKADGVDFDHLFYLDALPSRKDLKAAVTALRSKEGFFAIFDGEWRRARKLHAGLCKEKRKISGRRRADDLARLARWMEVRESFLSDAELKECFGELFRGLETNPDSMTRLYEWYRSSHASLVTCPGLVDKVDLTSIPADRLGELASKARTVKSDGDTLAGAVAALRDLLSVDIAWFNEARARGWDVCIESMSTVAKNLGTVAEFFTGRADALIAPKDAVRLMEARADLDSVASELSLLMGGRKALRDAGGEELGQLADLTGGPWSEVLPAITAHATEVAETAARALTFADKDSPLSEAVAFANAKADFDQAWSAVAPTPAWNRFEGWTQLADAARQTVVGARSVLGRGVLLSRAGVSINEFFAASDEEIEAQAIIERLWESEKVRKVLGDFYDGANTDLNVLETTHNWGTAVCGLQIPNLVRQRLLSADASSALDHAKQLYADIDDGCRKARELAQSLESYGSFSWDEWQMQTRSVAGRDLPSEIRVRLSLIAYSAESVLAWSKYLSLRQQADDEGLGTFASTLESGKLPSASLASAFELAAYQSIGRTIYRMCPELSRFNGNAHEKTRNEYRALDAEIISLTGKDFASQIDKRKNPPAGQRGTTVADYTEMQLLRREINKQRRHIPIRQLVKRAGKALQELNPCFMMGPLSVAQYLEQGALKFDLVVMDEASQLRPEEALGAIARGSQLVVVGDPKQLPPTSFFDRMLDAGDDEDESEAPAVVSGMESVLDICQQLFTPVRSLRWHYRSHHESLIAFSNHHFYKNLIVFPSPYAKNHSLGVKYRYVKGGAYKDRQNVPEAQRIVDAVLEHMFRRPGESLGVVTLNQTQRELIEELLERKLKTFEEGANFISRWEAEGWPFFVKNLENVQGDERDVIFISTTFGKAPGTDKVRQNFGPISRPDGWRRLNVLFTRSKRRIEMFTSLAPEDIIVDDRTPLGTKALRDYLDFAKRGVLVTTDEGERYPDSDFEVAVANVVRGLGYEVKPQLGVAGFFLDMAVRNPDRPGEFLAGIECDGATYHSGASVRDRDRIRQEILESLGWRGRIYRIWSTDWFYNPRREIERLRNFLVERQRVSASEDSGTWEDVDFDRVEADADDHKIADELAETLLADSDDTEDIFVEVGDRVTYCLVENPEERNSVLIVDSGSNPKMGIVNEETPLVRALLGLSSGDTADLMIPGQKVRQLKVLKIQRFCDVSASN